VRQSGVRHFYRPSLAITGRESNTPSRKAPVTTQDPEPSQVDELPDLEDLFPFRPEEKVLLARLAFELRRALFKLSPRQIQGAAHAILAIEQLPFSTPGAGISMSFEDRVDGGLVFMDVYVGECSFKLSKGGSDYSPESGSDSFSDTYFEVRLGGFRQGSSYLFEQWLGLLDRASGNWIVEGDGDGEMGLLDYKPSDGWALLAAPRPANSGSRPRRAP
jgi:hypothetical protein